MRPGPRLIALLLLACVLTLVGSRTAFTLPQKVATRDAEIAGRFAPIFYQALGDKPRSDYITNFDFDGDWKGDNNWNNVDNKDVPLKAYVYYSVAETSTHFFIHYAVFHPRDYKGGERKGTLLSELIRQGTKRGGKYDPTGLADEAALAHENDMEGALVVVKRNGNDLADSQVVYVETMQHNNFNRYQSGDPQPGQSIVKLEGQRPLLYVEPKGHGIEAFNGEHKQTSNKSFLRYIYEGKADNPAQTDFVCSDIESTPCSKSVGYELVSLAVLWAKAKGKTNATYGVTFDYGDIKLMTSLNGGKPAEKNFKVGSVGCAFLGKVGGVNMARPPWGWFDRDERDKPLGLWFFDPAKIVKSDFKLDSSFSTSYVQLPFWAK
jgi:hypothetical protein